jgi:hypothetical protein
MRLLADPLTSTACAWSPPAVRIHVHQILQDGILRGAPVLHRRNGLTMNAKSCTQPTTTRNGGSASRSGSRRPRPRQRSGNLAAEVSRDRAGKRVSNSLSPVIRSVVADFVDSLRSTGEGALPLVLAISPDLSTQDIAEDGPEFARRERLQSAAERRFFKRIEPPLRAALVRLLTSAARDFTHAKGDMR